MQDFVHQQYLNHLIQKTSTKNPRRRIHPRTSNKTKFRPPNLQVERESPGNSRVATQKKTWKKKSRYFCEIYWDLDIFFKLPFRGKSVLFKHQHVDQVLVSPCNYTSKILLPKASDKEAAIVKLPTFFQGILQHVGFYS